MAIAVHRILKDFTRTTSALLACRWTKGVTMLQLKTHFEQVPLETVRKIVAEQVRREQAAELARETNQKTEEEILAGIRGPSMTSLREFSEAEVYKQP
jgi:hypothetical protein